MINSHIHVFNYEFLPEDFLKIQLDGFMGEHSDLVLKFLESGFGRGVLKVFGRQELLKKVRRYSQFLNVGLYESQYEIYQFIDKTYQGYNPKYVVLSLNMDYMSDMGPGKANFETQLAELVQLKRYVGDKVNIFLSIDPRYKSGDDLRLWIEDKFSTGIFGGFKLYPALGYYPFDPGLKPMWDFADAYKLPITTHCTRYGSMFIGKDPWRWLNMDPNTVHGDPVMQRIFDRVQRYKKYNGPQQKKIQTNSWLCNLFLHPDNYIPILERYKNLKLCLAHFGGTEEMFPDGKDMFNGPVEMEIRKLDMGIADPKDYVSWYSLIRQMIAEYPNCYTDISYTVANKLTHPKIMADMQDPTVSDKIMFGTDFFMELKDSTEDAVLKSFLDDFKVNPDLMEKLVTINPNRFLTP